MNRFLQSCKKGFTLTEVILVVAIITVLASVGTYSWREISYRAQANKIVSDFKKIEGAWLLWRTDTHLSYPDENDFNGNIVAGNRTTEQPTSCVDEPLIDETDLVLNNTLGAPGYQGPYIISNIRDPFGLQYDYERDGTDVLDQSACTPGTDTNGYLATATGVEQGVNIGLHSCTRGSSYRNVVGVIDQAIDSGDGACLGKFRWQFIGTNRVGMLYSVSSN